MFLSTTHARQLLEPRQYGCPAQHAREMERLFLPGWQFVGTFADIPVSGDYLSFELFGEPVLVRNEEGEPHTYLNVCSHRFCTLVSKARGHDPVLRCQYHGWEYGPDGNTRKIPDAPSFRPLERGTLGLCKFRTECCGQLIFVSLAAEGPSLREYLGEHFEQLESSCCQGRPQILSFEHDSPVNWKVPVENNLESYHVDSVHPKTFGKMPDASVCEHELRKTSSTFRSPGGPTGLLGEFCSLVMRRLGLTPTRQYEHTHIFPNLKFYTQDLTIAIQTYIPTSPTTSRMLWNWFATTTTSPFWNRIAIWLNQIQRPFFRRVVAEDLEFYPKIQRGLSASRHPQGGLLATREERLRHFQEYIHSTCSAADTPTPDTSTPHASSTEACRGGLDAACGDSH